MSTKTLNLLVIFVAVLTFSACSNHYENPYTPEVKASYEAPHGLRKMFNKEEKTVTKVPSEGSMSGGFFLFMGGVNGSYKEGTTIEHSFTYVRFAWDTGSNVYAITDVSLNKVRVKIVEKQEVPTVSFFLDEKYIERHVASRKESYDGVVSLAGRNPPRFLESHKDYLDYVVITCLSSDWPQNITLPFNQ